MNNDLEISKISKLSLLSPEYVYINSQTSNPKIDYLSDYELDKFIEIMNRKDDGIFSNYHSILTLINHDYSIDNVDKYIDVDRRLPDYNILKGGRNLVIKISDL